MAVSRLSGFKGIDKVMRNINREVAKIKGNAMKGLIESVIFIRRDMEQKPPLVPLDWGNLRASWFVTAGYVSAGVNTENSGNFNGENAGEMSSQHGKVISDASGRAAGKPLVIFGFSANYASRVHEMVGPYQWKRPGSGPKFLESALKRNHGKILNIIAANAKRK